jgi:hypothetical protein
MGLSLNEQYFSFPGSVEIVPINIIDFINIIEYKQILKACPGQKRWKISQTTNLISIK